MRYSEKWGDSVEIAVELALLDLKLSRDQIEVTVLEEPSKGFFGIGSKLAKVRVEEKTQKKEEVRPEIKKEEIKREYKPEVKREYKPELKQEILIEVCGLDDPEDLKAAALRKTRDFKRNNDKSRRRPVRENFEGKGVNEKPEDLEENNDHPAGIFLSEVVKEMGLDVTIKAFSNKESVYIDIEGKDSGTIIGKRGQTLDALQYLTSLVVNKDKEGYIRVVIDAEGYRRKRETTLEGLANRLADKAVKSRRNVRLEPMNPYERKVIHTALQSRPEVITKSEGEEPYRRVVIEPSK
ncbi:MAG: protein jag [Clostridia bacterium]|nr:protein jag [Clostridia bacterium]